MVGPITDYFVAIFAMLLCSVGALTLIYAVDHLDPPEVSSSPVQMQAPEHATVKLPPKPLDVLPVGHSQSTRHSV
jgi:hypothetical protein